MARDIKIIVSTPGKVHLLGEHAVVYGKPAILAAIDLRVTVILRAKPEGSRRLSAEESETSSEILRSTQNDNIKKIIEPIVKKELKIKSIPSYELTIKSQTPIGAGLGSSAAISASFIGALLTFLRVKWDLDLINKLTYEAEIVFHGNPSGADNSTVVFGGLIWYRKENLDLKTIQPLPFSIPSKLSKNFILINTGKPIQTTKEMVEMVSVKQKVQKEKFKKIFDSQEQLVKELYQAIKESNEKEVIRIIRSGEKNLEAIGVCSPEVKKIIRQIEKLGGAAKICGGGANIGPTGILLCYHQDKKVLMALSKSLKLPYFYTKLGVEGVKIEGNL